MATRSRTPGIRLAMKITARTEAVTMTADFTFDNIAPLQKKRLLPRWSHIAEVLKNVEIHHPRAETLGNA